MYRPVLPRAQVAFHDGPLARRERFGLLVGVCDDTVNGPDEATALTGVVAGRGTRTLGTCRSFRRITGPRGAVAITSAVRA
jgi:hypothetical protein